MLNAFSVRWLEHDETKVVFTDRFKYADYVLQIDILQDAIGLLEEEKDKLMLQQAKIWKEKRKGNLYVAK